MGPINYMRLEYQLQSTVIVTGNVLKDVPIVKYAERQT